MLQSSTKTFLTAAVALVIVASILVPVISIRQSHRVKETILLVDSTQQVLRDVQGIVIAAIENESGARGFVLSGKESFLDRLDETERILNIGLHKLHIQLKNSPSQYDKIDSLGKYVLLRLKYSDSMVEMRRQKGLDETVEIIEEGKGKYLSDRIRQIADEVIQTQSLMLVNRKTSSENSIGKLNLILYTMLGAILLLGMTVIRRIWNGIKLQKENEQRFAMILDASPDSAILSNHEGIIQMVNIKTEILFGYTREELVGKKVDMLVPATAEDDRKSYRKEFTGGKSSKLLKQFEVNVIRKDGSTFPAEINLSPVRTKDGILISSAIRDISHRKNMEAELVKINSELEAFTYSVSHDLRAPLRAITGFSSILQEEYSGKLDDEAKRITGIIKGNALRMGNLIDDLLKFSRLGRQHISKSDVNMDLLVKDVINDIVAIEKSDRCKWEVAELPEVKADLNTIRQVWINLLSNALKYSSLAANPRVTVEFEQGKGETIFHIHDNGVGFDNKYRDKLFKVFQRLHSSQEFEGTGVGLALVDKIISRHGGRVWADGRPGEGAVFSFSLPDTK